MFLAGRLICMEIPCVRAITNGPSVTSVSLSSSTSCTGPGTDSTAFPVPLRTVLYQNSPSSAQSEVSIRSRAIDSPTSPSLAQKHRVSSTHRSPGLTFNR